MQASEADVCAALLSPDVLSVVLEQLGMLQFGSIAAVSHIWAQAVMAKLAEWAVLEEDPHDLNVGKKLGFPSFCCATPDGVLVAASFNNNVIHLGPAGETLTVVGSPGRAPGQMLYPTGVAVNGDELFLVDSANHRLQKMRLSDGALLACSDEHLQNFGHVQSAGAGSGQLGDPQGLAVVDGKTLVVTDGRHHRLSFFDVAALRWQRHVGSKGCELGEFYQPEGVAAHAGEIFVADSGNDRVQVVGASSGVVLRAFGGRGAAPGRFQMPRGLAVDREGRVLVAECGARRIQVLTTHGQPLQILPVPAAGKLRGLCVGTTHAYCADFVRGTCLRIALALRGR